MNGATAEPEVKTRRLPSKTMHAIIGNSQNFFLSFKKPQSSNKNSTMTHLHNRALAAPGLILLCEMRCRPGLPNHTVACRIRLQPPAHRIFSQPSSDKSNRGDDTKKNQPQDDPRIDPA